jgi:DNA-binding HxlR family transcriptional regulator
MLNTAAGLTTSHHKDFNASPEGIATNFLTDRLHKRVERGLAQKYLSTESAGRDACRLTKKAEALHPTLKAVAKWELENLAGTEQRMQPK